MTKEDVSITYENNIFYCTKNNTKWISVDGEKWYGEEKRIKELEDKIADIKANCDLAIEGRDVKIKELEKENEELRNNGFTVSAMTEQQLKVAIEKGKQLEKENAEQKAQLAKAKDLIEDMYDRIPASHSDYYKDVMERARQFIKEIEK